MDCSVRITTIEVSPFLVKLHYSVIISEKNQIQEVILMGDLNKLEQEEVYFVTIAPRVDDECNYHEEESFTGIFRDKSIVVI